MPSTQVPPPLALKSIADQSRLTIPKAVSDKLRILDVETTHLRTGMDDLLEVCNWLEKRCQTMQSENVKLKMEQKSLASQITKAIENQVRDSSRIDNLENELQELQGNHMATKTANKGPMMAKSLNTRKARNNPVTVRNLHNCGSSLKGMNRPVFERHSFLQWA
jgi:chromosome segregation ATPase